MRRTDRLWSRIVCLPLLLAGGCGGSEPSGTPAGPTSLADAIAVIDCRSLPVMDGAIYVTKTPVGLHFTVPKGEVAKAVEFYRTTLTPLGWKPADDAKLWQTYPVGAATPQGAQLVFFKQGSVLYASVGITPADGNLNCGLFHVGKVDARLLPQLEAVSTAESMPARVIYETAAKPEAVREFMRTELSKLGWHEYHRPVPRGMPAGAMRNENELLFLQQASVITIYVTPLDGKTQVMTGVALVREQAPLLPDATGIEFSEDPLVLMYETANEIEPALEFYRRELTTAGWKEREGAGETTPTNVVLAFDAPEREPLRLELLRHQATTIARVSRWPPEQK